MLGVRSPDRRFIDPGRVLAASLEGGRRSVELRLLALWDHRRMYAIGGRHLQQVGSPFAASNATRALKPASWLHFRTV